MKYFLCLMTFLVSFAALHSQENNKYYPVTHHIITRDNGTGGETLGAIDTMMSELNRVFAPAGIQFYMSCKGIDTIKSDV